MLNDRLFWESVFNTSLFTALATPALIGLGMVLALILNGSLRGGSGFRALFYLPNVLSVSVIGLIFVVVRGGIHPPPLQRRIRRFPLQERRCAVEVK